MVIVMVLVVMVVIVVMTITLAAATNMYITYYVSLIILHILTHLVLTKDINETDTIIIPDLQVKELMNKKFFIPTQGCRASRDWSLYGKPGILLLDS